MALSANMTEITLRPQQMLKVGANTLFMKANMARGGDKEVENGGGVRGGTEGL